MSDRCTDISSCTGKGLTDKLLKLIKDKENWKGGKWYKFDYKHGEQTILVFQIKACKKLIPIEEAVKFENAGSDLSWSNDQILSDDEFGAYHKRFLTNEMRTFDKDIMNKRHEFRVCIMLAFEIARWSLEDCDAERAISIVLNQTDRDIASDDISDLCKMFPKCSTKTEDERRKIAWRAIIRRQTEKDIENINKWWPTGIKTESVLEILSGSAMERKYAFVKFEKTKKKRNKILLSQDPIKLEFFKTIATTSDEEDSRRAFQQLDKFNDLSSDEAVRDDASNDRPPAYHTSENQDALKYINRWWPAGESIEDILEILSADPLERRYAFEKFELRKKKRNDAMRNLDQKSLEFFKTVLTTVDNEDSERAFKLLNAKLGDGEEE